MPQQQSTEFIRRKSSGSSVHSNNSTTIEPHIYEFQESERHADSSLVIRLVKSRKISTFYLHNRNPMCMLIAYACFMAFTFSRKWWQLDDNDGLHWQEFNFKFKNLNFFPIRIKIFRIPSYSHIAACSDASQKLQSNSTFYRFTRLLNNSKQLPLPTTTTAGDERRTSWDKR